MNHQTEKEKLKTLITETLTLLCKNGLTFQVEFSVEALIGVTLDKQDIMLININECIKSDNVPPEDSPSPEPERFKKRNRKRSRTQRTETGDVSSDDAGGLSEDHDSDEPSVKVQAPNIKQESEDLSEDIVFVKEESDNWSSANWQGETLDNSSDHVGFSRSTQNMPEFLSGTSMMSDGSQNSSMMWAQDSSGGALPGQEPGAQRPDTGQYMDREEIPAGYKRCSICGLTMNITSFRDHVRRHLGKYAFRCNICEKGFMRKRDFEGHMSIHTGVKAYECSFCRKAFSLKCNLRSHERNVHHTAPDTADYVKLQIN